MAKLIELKGISKSYDGEKVIDCMNLYIRDGEFITLLGPSGCGKTTTLRIIGGFETADEGELYFDGKEISDVPAYKRHINTVFQKYALFPHLNVYENIAFPLRLKKKPEDEIKQRVSEMLKMVALAFAPDGVLANSQFFLPITNGLMLRSARLLSISSLPSSIYRRRYGSSSFR